MRWVLTTIKQTEMEGNKAISRRTIRHYSTTGMKVETIRQVRKPKLMALECKTEKALTKPRKKKSFSKIKKEFNGYACYDSLAIKLLDEN